MFYRDSYRKMRTSGGGTIIEMLISTVIMTFASASMLMLLYQANHTNWRVTNKLNATDQARIAIERVGRDVRMGRSIGDVFGDPIQLDPVNDPGLLGFTGSDSFPSALNPLYGNNQVPPGGGWPGAPWPKKPYQLSNTCLVVQVPIFYRNPNNANDPMNGWPTMIPAGTNGTTENKDNVETHIYLILPDPNNPGEFTMQLFKCPGLGSAGYDPVAARFGPEVVCKNIVGPMDPNNPTQPKIFQYVDRTDGTGQPQDTVDAPRAANYTGVIVNLEIKKDDVGAGPKHDSTVGFKTEIFMRNNALATTTGNRAPFVP